MTDAGRRERHGRPGTSLGGGARGRRRPACHLGDGPGGAGARQEQSAFRAKVTAAGRETAGADWRSRQHDNPVLALATAAFLGENGLEFWLRLCGGSEGRHGAGEVTAERSAALGTVYTVPTDRAPAGADGGGQRWAKGLAQTEAKPLSSSKKVSP
jgi:hypothetical protein